MPQYDKRRSCDVPIEFSAVEDLFDLPSRDRATLVLVTDGKAIVSINGDVKTLIAPCAICISERDHVEAIEDKRLFSQSFSLSPAWLKSRTTYKLFKSGFASVSEEELRNLLEPFYYRDAGYGGTMDLSPDAYIKVFEWMGIIGTEIAAQSDGRWTCRVRAYFLRILNLLAEVYERGGEKIEADERRCVVDAVLEYLHVHYMEEITLDALCAQAHTNRTTLNKRFRERTGQTVIAYLLDYRVRVARELLAHTSLTVNEVARASGFAYDTYLIRRFTAKAGQSPTEYRQEARRKYGIVTHKD